MDKEKAEKKVSTESYKGVRDFYPEDMFTEKYIFDTMRKAVESFGYVEYGASILEPTELYRSKTSEEIVNEQTYSFKDRGDRDVTLRPEMTPTVARMVAGKKRELSFPLRWYSIPNLFRYEKPQRGRLREHFQLNVDLFGVAGIEGEIEIISAATKVMESFGAKSKDYEIRINSRKLLQQNIEKQLIDKTSFADALRLIDKKEKLPEKIFADAWKKIATDPLDLTSSPSGDLKKVIDTLQVHGITNVVYSPTMVRGFDYYTDIVFEIFDTNKENPRALGGGGRYDDLLSLFGNEKVSAIGFGMGDVTIRDFLETRELLPTYMPSAHLYIAKADGADEKMVAELATRLREKNINVLVDISGKKVGDQLKKASKDKVPFVIVIGKDEMESGEYKLKTMSTGDEETVNEQKLITLLTK